MNKDRTIYTKEIMRKEQASTSLRFIMRDGEKVLQQAHFYDNGIFKGTGYIWKDVPLITDFIDEPSNKTDQ